MAWYNESERHRKAALGIKTGRKCPASCGLNFKSREGRMASKNKRRIPVKREASGSGAFGISPISSSGIHSGTVTRTVVMKPIHSESQNVKESHGSMFSSVKGMLQGFGLGLEQKFIQAKHILEPRARKTEIIDRETGEPEYYVSGGTEKTKEARGRRYLTRAALAESGIKTLTPMEEEEPSVSEEQEEEMEKETEKVYEQEGIRVLGRGTATSPNNRVRQVIAKRKGRKW